MKNTRLLFAATLVATLVAAPAFAQDNARQQDQDARLRVDIGSAMVSTGGEFATAASGMELAAGNRVMLAEGHQATLVYDNGCTQTLKEAGVYTVSSTCVAAVPLAGGGSMAGGAAAGTAAVDVAGLGILTGVALGGAAILNEMDEVPYVEPPPVSR